MDLIKILCSANDIKRIKRQASDWGKYLQGTYPKMDAYPKYTKTLKSQQRWQMNFKQRGYIGDI